MTINKPALNEIAHKNQTAEAFFTYAACRVRNARDGVSRIPAIRAQMQNEGFHPVPSDLMTMFKDLEKAGVGVLQGKNFKWNVPIKLVGQSAQSPVLKTKAPVPKPSKKTLTILFTGGREAHISFTDNLTETDVAFLAERLLNECKD